MTPYSDQTPVCKQCGLPVNHNGADIHVIIHGKLLNGNTGIEIGEEGKDTIVCKTCFEQVQYIKAGAHSKRNRNKKKRARQKARRR